jgi:iron complex outermembrane receptor protein
LVRERVEISGWELNGYWQVSSASRVGAIYSNTDSQYDSNNDDRVDSDLYAMEAPPDRLSLYWIQHWTDHWSSHLQVNHDVSRTFFTEGAKIAEFDSYTLADISLKYRISNNEFSLGISNLTDRQYIPYLTQAEATRNDRYFAGRGRSLMLGYRGQF